MPQFVELFPVMRHKPYDSSSGEEPTDPRPDEEAGAAEEPSEPQGE